MREKTAPKKTTPKPQNQRQRQRQKVALRSPIFKKQKRKIFTGSEIQKIQFPHKLHSDSANPAFHSRKSCNSYITTKTNTKITTTTHATSKISTAEEIAESGFAGS
jgi:hypothetical protein